MGRAIIRISATINSGMITTPPSTKRSAKTGKIGMMDAKLVVPATATPNSERTMANRIARPVNSTGKAKMANTTLSTMLSVAP